MIMYFKQYDEVVNSVGFGINPVNHIIIHTAYFSYFKKILKINTLFLANTHMLCIVDGYFLQVLIYTPF